MSIIEKAAQRMGISHPVPPAASDTPSRDMEPPAAEVRREPVVDAAAPGVAEAAAMPRPSSAQWDTSPTSTRTIQVDIQRLQDMGMITPEAGRSKIAEEYRLIKRPLLANAFGGGDTPPIENGNLIMVTSSLPGEGKSFTAINLAISMATEMESTVLLVDADVTKSAVNRYLDFEADHGLLDVLRNPRIPLSDVLVKTDIAKLTVLPAGQTFAHATELLASSAMRHFVHDISTRYSDRIIIFDTPPLLATSEASVLASYMGQIVFVVEAERTPQEALTDALSQLGNHEHVGLVLNKAPVRIGSSDYYYYGYRYGYGYGYGEYAKQ